MFIEYKIRGLGSAHLRRDKSFKAKPAELLFIVSAVGKCQKKVRCFFARQENDNDACNAFFAEQKIAFHNVCAFLAFG